MKEPDPVDYENEEYDLARGWDRFGAALAVGDTTGDGKAELVVGVPDESVEEELDPAVGPVVGGGAVHVLLGRAGGVTAQGSSYWTQNSPGIVNRAEMQENIDGDPEPGDAFGSSLAIGDVDGDERGDVAVGIPRELVNNEQQGGVRGAPARRRRGAARCSGRPDGHWQPVPAPGDSRPPGDSAARRPVRRSRGGRGRGR